jgi:hypothetical protein
MLAGIGYRRFCRMMLLGTYGFGGGTGSCFGSSRASASRTGRSAGENG